jgi:hypothetical protein
MPRFATGGRLGVPDLDTSETTAQVPLGTIVRGTDTVTGCEGEYQYVRFAATTTEGQPVCIDLTNKCPLADSDDHVNDGVPIGFALAAQDADDYGFVQIVGKTKVKAGTVAAGGKVMLTATGGTTDDAAVAGAQLSGAEFDTADGTPAAGFAYATIDHPRVQTQIT